MLLKGLVKRSKRKFPRSAKRWVPVPILAMSEPSLPIRDILVRNRILLFSSRQQKAIFFQVFLLIIFFEGALHLHNFSKIKSHEKSQ
jgi:hypothetical protein